MTLWIAILGFTSGRTAWVMTDGSAPYGDDNVPSDDRNGVVGRLCEKGVEALKEQVIGADTINMLTFCKTNHKTISTEEALKALDLRKLLRGEDALVDLLPLV